MIKISLTEQEASNVKDAIENSIGGFHWRSVDKNLLRSVYTKISNARR